MKKREQSDLQSCFREPQSKSETIALSAIIFAFVVLAVLISLTACVRSNMTKVPSYEEARNSALKEAPFIRKPIEERQKLKCGDKPVTLRKDATKGIPFTGNLLTNDRVECLVAVQAERDRLRRELSAERLRTRTKEIINDAAVKRLAEEAKPTWWQQHSWKVLSPLLITAGGALVIAVLYALTGGKSIGVSTNAFIKP